MATPHPRAGRGATYARLPYVLRGALCVAAVLLWVHVGFSQTIIATVAGSRFSFPADGVAAISAPLGFVTAIAADPQGDTYVADSSNDRVFRIDTQGVLTVFAGSGVQGYAGDGGAATSAALFNPTCLVFDSNRNLYICDSGNFRIRRITAAGVISTFAGNGERGFAGDGGPAVAASFGSNTRVAIDSSDNVYVSDSDNHRIRRITADGVIRTFAGNGADANAGDGGQALAASLRAPQGLVFDSNGNLFFADSAGQVVRKILRDGTISTVAGNGFFGETGDGSVATRAKLNSPSGVALDSGYNLFIADVNNSRIRRVDPSGTITTFAGGDQVGLAGDGGPAALASLYGPLDLAFTPVGALLVADSNNLRARYIANGKISTIAGNGNYRYGGDGGPGSAAQLPAPSGIVIDSSGDVTICDNFANRVRRVDVFGNIHLVAGANAPGYAGDGGPAASGVLADCAGIAADSAGNIYIADTGNRRIRKINASGFISTIAGTGVNGYSGDGGPATLASLSNPQGVAADAQGNIYIADTGNHVVRKVSPQAVITTVAGTGDQGYAGDGGPAVAAELNFPSRLAIDVVGNLYVSDSGNNVVRRVSTTGTIRTVAGNSKYGFSGDGGLATAAALANPRGLAVDGSGGLLIADGDNMRIRRVDTNGVISTIAGNGSPTLSGDGRPPLNTGFGFPADVALDFSGNIYIADRNNSRVRRIQPAPTSLVISQAGLTFSPAVDAAVVATRNISILNGGVGTIGWSASARTTAGSANWLKISPTQGTSTTSAASVLAVTADPAGLTAGSYYGQIQIVAPGVTNSPRFITVVLNVLSAAQTTGPAVSPAGFVFSGVASGGNPAAQTLTVSKLHGAALTFTSAFAFDQSVAQGSGWLTAKSASSTVATGQPVAIALTPNIAGLAAGAYTGTLKLTFSDGSARVVPLALTLAPAGSASSTSRFRPAASCTAAKLVPVVTAISSGFSLPAGWPVAIEAQVVDDCGHNVNSGTAIATFSNGDPPLALAALGSGTWSGTWQPRTAAANAVITLTAQTSAPAISGTAQVGGQIAANAEPPILNAGGILNSASFFGQTPLAPGTLVSVFGLSLATSAAQAATLPLPTTLGGTQVLIGGIPMPLLYAGPGQINAQVPFDLPVGTAQVIVQNGKALSVPEPAAVGATGPGAFTLTGSGTGTAIVVAVNPDGSAYLVGPSAPAHPGGVVVIYCTGLGGVQDRIEAGTAAPLSPLAQANDSVSVTLGGATAQVLFAGLVPTLSGLYQINAVIPPGVTGDNVPLVLTAGGTVGSAVTLPIR